MCWGGRICECEDRVCVLLFLLDPIAKIPSLEECEASDSLLSISLRSSGTFSTNFFFRSCPLKAVMRRDAHPNHDVLDASDGVCVKVHLEQFLQVLRT